MSDESRFDEGHEVDDLARKLFAGGFEVQEYNEQGWKNTKAAIKDGHRILYQPTAVAGKITCRADILVYHAKSRKWDLYEVKSSASVKDEHYWDVGFQRLCFEKAGIPIGKTFLVHIDRDFVRNGDVDPEAFFIKSDITEDVWRLLPEVTEEIPHALAVLSSESKPGASHLGACVGPKKCKFLPLYIDKIPVPTLRELHRYIEKKRMSALLEAGMVMPKHVPKAYLESLGRVSVPDPHRPPEIHINAAGIRRTLAKLEYPLFFLDYETVGPAIPPFDGYRPYQHTPFQYSLDIVRKPGAKVEHYEYLADSFEDPVPGLVKDLKKHLGPKGTVISWFATFESGRNDLMGLRCPEYAAYLRGVNRRMFDLMLVFKGRDALYSHSNFGGSASLKKVLPVLLPELAYDDLAIQEGGTASNSWFELTGSALKAAEKKQLRKDMLAYCERDTYAMVEILRLLEKLSSK